MDRPFAAYKGDEPYIFVSYSHSDSSVVYNELIRLKENGFNVWYDEGIEGGTEWREELGQAILHARVFLYFVTPDSVQRENCRKELNFAVEEQIPVLAVHLASTTLPPGVKLTLSDRQAIFRNELPEQEYQRKLQSSISMYLNPSISSQPAVKDHAKTQRRGWRIAVGVGLLAVTLFLVFVWFENTDRRDGVYLEDRGFEVTRAGIVASSLKVGIKPFTVTGDNPALEDAAEIAVTDIRTMLTKTGLSIVDYADADYVLEGNVRRLTEGVRFTVELRRVLDGKMVWSVPLDARLDLMVFKRASYVSRKINRYITIISYVMAGSGNYPASEEEALAGFFALEERNIRVAINHFERAAEIDPEWSLPWVNLGFLYAARLDGDSLEESLRQAHRVNRILFSIPGGVTATGPLARMNLNLELDYESAIRNYEQLRRSSVVSVSSAEHFKCEAYFSWGDLKEALSRCFNAVRGGEDGAHSTLGWVLLAAARYEEARSEFEQAMQVIDYDDYRLLMGFTEAAFRGGDVDASNHALDRAWEIAGDRNRFEFPGLYALVGRTDKARDILEGAENRFNDGSLLRYSGVFHGHFVLENLDEAFIWLDRAIDNREHQFIGLLKSASYLTELRRDSRFTSSLQRLHKIEVQGSSMRSVATDCMTKPRLEPPEETLLSCAFIDEIE